MIQADPEHLAEIRKIFEAHLPAPFKLLFFGSRVQGNSRPDSDLDILVETEEPLDFATTGRLRAEFEDSNIPFQVDFVSNHSVDRNFLEKIAKHAIPYP